MQASLPRLIDFAEVTRITSLQKTAIYDRVKDGEFHLIKLGRKSVFCEAEIVDWVNDKLASITRQYSAQKEATK